MSPSIRRKYKYFHSTVETAEVRRQKFPILPFSAWNCLLKTTFPFEAFILIRFKSKNISHILKHIQASEEYGVFHSTILDSVAKKCQMKIKEARYIS